MCLPVALVLTAGVVLLQVSGWVPLGVHSSAMQPNLSDEDFVFLEPIGEGRIRRGDIVAFHAPAGSGWGRDAMFLQRVVGLPGERIEFKSGVPIVNGIAALQTFKREDKYRWKSAIRLSERLPDGTTYEIYRLESNGPRDNVGPFNVPAQSYFVLGDSRDDAFDSRGFQPGVAWYVPRRDVTGRAKYVYWAGFDRLDRIGWAVK